MDRLLLVVAAISLSALLALAFILIRRRPIHRDPARSEVYQQHLYLFQGGYLSEPLVEAEKALYRRLLAAGDRERVQKSLQPGVRFAVQVRALTEIGGYDAADVLERQLQCRMTDDALEQSWYWLDLAHALRRLERSECVPALFCCFGWGEFPLARFLAAEIACYSQFQSYLMRPDGPGPRTALRVLHSALVGLRSGVQPHVVACARLGEAIELAWDHRPDGADPLSVRVFAEALRLLDRSKHAERSLGNQAREQTEFRAQINRIARVADVVNEYLADVKSGLLARLERATPRDQGDLLHALIDVRAESAPIVIPLLERNALAPAHLALASLAFSQDESVGEWICAWTKRHPSLVARRARRDDRNLLAALETLRHFPSLQSETTLLEAAASRGLEIRAVALRSLGWWEPFRRADVLSCLQFARFAPQNDIQNASQAALARLGERYALQWFRQKFVGENRSSIHQAIQHVADEGILLLWPDLDHLADAEDSDVAYHACEALEQLREACILSPSLT